ncbi:sensor histidine kinase [Azospirillum sp.]|uniref:sensor histidine kinase n=1 Tax=Azospirillum sp. TaxID=34012 RepID=UPI002D443986|nr:histidine kinase dimerization/phosphoacceptor domain -containing protein [Azospirillum sp.]HYD67124.1 histidine kinase dimerization/phosphoacceptor domain -containing protein [Azospirillum sp.]
MADEPESNRDDDALVARVSRYQDILTDYSRIAAEAKELGRLLQLTCVQAARGIGIKRTKIMRYRPAMGDLLVEAGVGWKPGVVGQVKLGTDIASPPGRTFQTRLPLVIDDLPNDPEFRYSPVLQEHGIVSALNVPMAADGVVWGVLEVDSEEPRHFSQSDAKFLTAMGNILGMAVQRKLLEHHAGNVARKAIADVEQQKMLMRELLHRDKNDFQLIMALLVMQQSKQQDPNVRQAFRHVLDRVAAISMAHDQLSMRPETGTIDLADYLQALCGNFDQRREGIRIETQCEHADLVRERAVPLGLITNELVTNAIKHAFPDGRGTVRVEFTVDQATEQGRLTVADNGTGMGPPRPGSAGLPLVQSLAEQVGASVRQESPGRGTVFRITFPLVV